MICRELCEAITDSQVQPSGFFRVEKHGDVKGRSDMGSPYKWPKIKWATGGYFTPISGDTSANFALVGAHLVVIFASTCVSLTIF